LKNSEFKEVPSVLRVGRIARAEPPVELEQRLFRRAGEVLVEGGTNVLVVGVRVSRLVHLSQLLVGPEPDSAKQCRDRNLPLPVYLDRQHVSVAGFELQPRSPVRDQLRHAERPPAGWILVHREVDARGANQLAHDDTLGAIDNEGAVFCHEREVAHEYVLLLDLAGGLDSKE
jgi:hypothetical protein